MHDRIVVSFQMGDVTQKRDPIFVRTAVRRQPIRRHIHLVDVYVRLNPSKKLDNSLTLNISEPEIQPLCDRILSSGALATVTEADWLILGLYTMR